MNFKHLIQAARLRTLPLSVSGIIVGCYFGHSYFIDVLMEGLEDTLDGIVSFGYESVIESSIFWLAILTTIGLQVLSNFANDYGDGIKGTDKNRVGEQRLVASGIISPKQMKNAMLVTAIITFIFATLLIYKAFGSKNFGYSILFFLLLILSIAAAIKYTVGKNAYGYSGFGDVFVFLFFGWLSVVGSCFLYTKEVQWDIFLPATTIGLLSVAVLNLNNLRDREEDAKANKNTLVVKLGSKKAKIYHYTLILLALVCAIIYVQLHYFFLLQYIFLIAFIPLLLNIVTVAKNTIPKELDSELKKVALSTFLFAILFAIFN